MHPHEKSVTVPRAKPIYPRYWEEAGIFRIGAQRGLTLEISDPQGQLWHLLNLLDGTRGPAEVVDAMRQQYPDVQADDILRAMSDLDARGLLDDGSSTRYDSDPRYSRYAGNVNYFSHFSKGTERRGQAQDKLCDARVCLLGLGGGGSTILQLLAGVGVGAIRAVDDDHVEMTNLNRQLLFQESDVGALKTTAAQDFMSRRNTLIGAEFEECRVDSPAAASRLIEGSDIVISAIDQPPGIVQRFVNKACVEAGIPCVYGASQVTRGRVFSVIPGESGCIDCLYVHYDHTDAKWAKRFKDFTGLDFRAPTLAFAPNLMRICAELVDEVVRILTGYLPPRSVGVQLEIDFEAGGTYALSEWRWSRDPENCPTCGDGAEVPFAARIGSPALTERLRVP